MVLGKPGAGWGWGPGRGPGGDRSVALGRDLTPAPSSTASFSSGDAEAGGPRRRSQTLTVFTHPRSRWVISSPRGLGHPSAALGGGSPGGALPGFTWRQLEGTAHQDHPGVPPPTGQTQSSRRPLRSELWFLLGEGGGCRSTHGLSLCTPTRGHAVCGQESRALPAPTCDRARRAPPAWAPQARARG